jgi:hypothetical protein
VIQGQSFTITLSLSPAQNLTDWTCTIQPKDNDGNVLFTRTTTTLSEDTLERSILITETDSKLLTLGLVKVGYELKNSETDECSPGVILLSVDPDPIT